jgi:hypothetical protein
VKRFLRLAANFNPAEFVGSDWAVWKGPTDGNGLNGVEDRDVREDLLTEVDIIDLLFEDCLQGDSLITRGLMIERAQKSGKVRLGGKTFLALWQDYQETGRDSFLEHLYKTRGISYLDFIGLVLRHPAGIRSILVLYRTHEGLWKWADVTAGSSGTKGVLFSPTS